MPLTVVVMGVSSVGKSTAGTELARLLGANFIDADDLHPKENVEKMRAGIALDDADRWPWLDRVGEALSAPSTTGIVVACSALKRAFRDVLRSHQPETFFVHLVASPERLAAHTRGRHGHFMSPTLLRSQLTTLEPLSDDERGVTVTVSDSAEQTAALALSRLAERP